MSVASSESNALKVFSRGQKQMALSKRLGQRTPITMAQAVALLAEVTCVGTGQSATRKRHDTQDQQANIQACRSAGAQSAMVEANNKSKCSNSPRQTDGNDDRNNTRKNVNGVSMTPNILYALSNSVETTSMVRCPKCGSWMDLKRREVPVVWKCLDSYRCDGTLPTEEPGGE